MSNITLDDLKGMNDIPGETIVNPNLKKSNNSNGSKRMVIDPAKEFNIPSKKDLEANDPEKQGMIDQAHQELDKVIERKTQEAIIMHDLEEQTEGQITYQDYVDAHDGFDPLNMMKNPPQLGVSKEVREANAKLKEKLAESQQDESDVEADPEIEYNTTPVVYKNDDVDPVEEENQIIDSIPDEDEEEILADMEADDENYDADLAALDIEDEETAKSEVEKVLEEIQSTPVTEEDKDDDEVVDRSKVLYEMPDNIGDLIHRDEDEDLKALDDDSSSETVEDEVSKKRLENLKKDAVSKITPVTSAFNLSQFTISSKPISMNVVTSASKEAFQKCGDWALMHSKRPITMRSFRGSEIASLLKENDRNRLVAAREMYGVIHDHVVDPNKPENVDDWLKTIKVADVDNLYAAIYRASFEGQNYLPYDCPDDKCANSFLSNNVPFMNMVKFKDEATEKEFKRIYNSTPSVEKSQKINVDLVPISDNCVIGFKEPSIYDAVIMPSYLDDAFINKYNDMITLSTCVEQIFFIDRAANELKPIAIKQYKNDPKKSLKAKIITLAKIMKELTSDQYQLVKIYVEKLTGMESNITFKVPEINCPKCGKTIEEAEFSAAQLVFIRHHLASLVNG